MALAGEQNQKRIPESLWHRVLRPVSYLSFLCSMTLNRMEPWNTSHAKFQYLVCVASQNDVSQRSQAIYHAEITYIEQNFVQNILYCITLRHITTKASKQASEVYDQDRAVLDALK